MSELAHAFGKLAAVPPRSDDTLGFLPPAAKTLPRVEQLIARSIMRKYETLPSVDEVRNLRHISKETATRVWVALGGQMKTPPRQPKAVRDLTPAERVRFNQAMRAYSALPALGELKAYLRIRVEQSRNVHRAMRAAFRSRAA